jgi:hypothetical protein
MKRITSIAFALLVLLALAPAQVAIPALQPRDARSMGLGGFFTSLSSGFDTIWGNPASAALGKGRLTLADLSVWGYVKPTTANINALTAMADGSASDSDKLGYLSDMIVDNGSGGGFSAGIGYTGKGFCIGTYVIGDAAARGPTALGAVARGAVSFNAVLGFGAPIRLGGMTLSLGADVRPFFRVDSEDGGWLMSGFLGALATGGDLGTVLNDQRVEAGFGMALDAGAQLKLGSLTAGVAIRDLTPSFLTVNEKISDLLARLEAGRIPDVSSGSETEAVYPYITAGLSWKPVLIKGFIEPGLYLELEDPVALFLDDNYSPWNLLHLGADVRFLSFIDVRAGLNKGWLSAGIGLDLSILRFDLAVFTEELGAHPGDQGMSGVSARVSFGL